MKKKFHSYPAASSQTNFDLMVKVVRGIVAHQGRPEQIYKRDCMAILQLVYNLNFNVMVKVVRGIVAHFYNYSNVIGPLRGAH
jgi:hypothetical protein